MCNRAKEDLVHWGHQALLLLKRKELGLLRLPRVCGAHVPLIASSIES